MMKVHKRVFWVVLLSVGAGLAVILSALSVEAQKSKPAEGTARRTLAAVVTSSDRATVSDGFVIRLYSEAEVKRKEKTAIDHNKRYDEYKTKRNAINKRMAAINAKLPVDRLLRSMQSTLLRYDANRDGFLTVKELDSRRLGNETDQNKDGRLSKPELIRWMSVERGFGFSRGGGLGAGGRFGGQGANQTAASSALSVKEIEKLLNDHAKVKAETEKLVEEYNDVRRSRYRSKVYYRVVEMTSEFLRLRSGNEERIIPVTSIQEFRRYLSSSKK